MFMTHWATNGLPSVSLLMLAPQHGAAHSDAQAHAHLALQRFLLRERFLVAALGKARARAQDGREARCGLTAAFAAAAAAGAEVAADDGLLRRARGAGVFRGGSVGGGGGGGGTT